MAVGGEVKVVMTLDDKQFNVRIKNAGQLLNQFERTSNRTGRSVKRIENHFGSWTTKLRHAVTTLSLARGALQNLNDIFLSLPRSIIRTNAQIERMTFLMAGMSKETTIAKKNLEALNNVDFVFDLATKAPFTLEALTDAFVKMKSVGLEPTKGAMNALTDAVAFFGGTEDHLHRASIAIQQMAGKGVVSMEELRQQIGEAVPNAMILMARGMGMSTGDFVKAVSQGTVEATTALQKMFVQMEVEMGGAAERMMKTWAGMVARMKTEWIKFQIAIGRSGFFKELKDEFRSLLDFITSEGAANLAETIGNTLLNAFREMRAVVLNLMPVWETLGNGLRIAAILAVGLWRSFVTLTEIIRDNEDAFNALIALGLGLWLSRLAVNLNIVTASQAVLARTSLGVATVTQSMRASYDTLLASIVRTRQAEAARTLGMNAMNAVTVQATTLNRAYAASYVAVATGARVAVGAIATLGRGLLAFVGGPLGALIIGLATAVWWFTKLKDETSELEGIERSLILGDAKSFFNPEQLKAYNDELEKAKRRLQGLKEELAGDQRFLDAESGEGGRPRDIIEQEIYEVEQIISRMELVLERSASNLGDKIGKDTLDALKQSMEDFVQEARTKASLAGEKFRETFVADAELSQKDQDNARRRGILTAQIEVLQGQADELTGTIERLKKVKDLTDEQQFYMDQLYLARGKLFDTIERLVADRDQDNKFVESSTRNNQKNPLERMIERFIGEKAQVEVLRRSIHLGGVALDEADVLIAKEKKFFDKWEAGGFDRRNKDGEWIRPDKELARRAANLQANIEWIKRVNRVLGKAREASNAAGDSFTDAINSFRSGGLTGSDAVDKMQRKFNKLRRELNLTGADLLKFNEFEKESLAATAGQTLFDFVTPFVQQTKEIRASLTEGNRERREAEFVEEERFLIKEYNLRMIMAKKYLSDRGQLTEENIALLKEAEKGFRDYLVALSEEHAREMETPLRKLAREWEDITAQMERAAVRWTTNALDSFMNFVDTGKFEFTEFVESILKDILRIQIQNMATRSIAPAFDAIAAGIGVGLQGGTSAGASSAAESVWSGYFRSANGNVMTEFGPAALKSFGKGGIAHKPMVSVFGEGSTPEAYVPLPDGRSIPVTMEGSQPNVTVNVINQSSVPVNAQQKPARFDGEKMILDVVLKNVNRPGQFRDSMKGAMRG